MYSSCRKFISFSPLLSYWHSPAESTAVTALRTCRWRNGTGCSAQTSPVRFTPVNAWCPICWSKRAAASSICPPAATELARKAAEINGLAERLTICSGDLRDPLLPAGGFDLAVCNPPYYPADMERNDVLDLELRPKKFHAHDIHLEQLDKPHLTQIEQSYK